MLTLLVKVARSVSQDRQGVTAIEYGLIAAFIAVLIIAGVKGIGTGLSTTFKTISSSL